MFLYVTLLTMPPRPRCDCVNEPHVTNVYVPSVHVTSTSQQVNVNAIHFETLIFHVEITWCGINCRCRRAKPQHVYHQYLHADPSTSVYHVNIFKRHIAYTSRHFWSDSYAMPRADDIAAKQNIFGGTAVSASEVVNTWLHLRKRTKYQLSAFDDVKSADNLLYIATLASSNVKIAGNSIIASEWLWTQHLRWRLRKFLEHSRSASSRNSVKHVWWPLLRGTLFCSYALYSVPFRYVRHPHIRLHKLRILSISENAILC